MNTYEVKVFTDRNLSKPVEVKMCYNIIQAQYCFAEMCERVRETYGPFGYYVYLYDLHLDRDILLYSCLLYDDGVHEELIPCHR